MRRLRGLGVVCVVVSMGANVGAQGQFLANTALPPQPVPADNPITDAKVRLGAQLYFDTRLSADRTVSCATCHRPKEGWANHGTTDTGIRGQVGGRNSGTILNAGYMHFQFWDGRAATLEEQALGPIQNPIEMGETLESVVQKLNAIPGYHEQFEAVFGTAVSAATLAKAIAAFERTVVSGPSPYDRFLEGERDALSRAAQRGLDLFRGKGHCLGCHSGPTFADQRYHNLGVGMDKPNPDLGREKISTLLSDRGRFKTPTLRNIALTAPYLHDGSEATLLAVVEFYNRGGVPNANLDPLMVPLALSEGEKSDLVAFMEALSGTPPVVEPPALPPDAASAGAASGGAL